MTEVEAIKFLETRRRWRGKLGDENLSLGELISKIRRSSIALIPLAASQFSLAALLISKAPILVVIEIVLGFLMIGFSTWSLIRLRQACQALGYSTDGSSRLSGTR